MAVAVLKVVAVSLYGTPHTLDWGSAVCNITLSQHNVGTIKVLKTYVMTLFSELM